MFDRADTTLKKMKVLTSLFYTWVKYPQLRLGQLIVNMVEDEKSIFYVEDLHLARRAEKYRKSAKR